MTIEAPPRSAPRRSKGRRITQIVGLLMVLAGLGFLGYFAWQYWGTNVVAKHRQAEIKTALHRDWDKGIDSKAIGLLRVPRFGKDFEVPINSGGDFQGKKSTNALARGVAWYDKGAEPGEIGNFVIAGHRVTHGEPFKDFLKLKEGDEVLVETRQKIYTYELRNDGDAITVDFTVAWPLFAVPDPDERDAKPTERLMTMLTCSELFHTRNRNVVVGELERVQDKATGRVSDATEADQS